MARILYTFFRVRLKADTAYSKCDFVCSVRLQPDKSFNAIQRGQNVRIKSLSLATAFTVAVALSGFPRGVAAS
jgi:hypothetical protein